MILSANEPLIPKKLILPDGFGSNPFLQRTDIQKIPVPVGDFIYVFSDKETEDEISIKALNEESGEIENRELYFDTGFHPLKYRRIWGIVASVPARRPPQMGQRIGLNGKVEDYVRIFNPPVEVVPGDKVYFHYNSLDEDSRLILADGRVVYMVEYQNLFCAVRWHSVNAERLEYRMMNEPDLIKRNRIVDAGKEVEIEFNGGVFRLNQMGQAREREIVMLNGRVLVHPKMETWADCFLGGIIGGIQTKLHPEPVKERGIIKEVGNPEEGFIYKSPLNRGDEIYFDKDCEFENIIEDQPYYVMYMRDVIAKFN
jgi:co-chaperonin GroES (HSP10)